MTESESADRGSAMTDVASSHGLYRIAGVRHARTLSVYRMSAVKRISRDAHTLARSRGGGAVGEKLLQKGEGERARRNSTREEMKIRTLVHDFNLFSGRGLHNPLYNAARRLRQRGARNRRAWGEESRININYSIKAVRLVECGVVVLFCISYKSMLKVAQGCDLILSHRAFAQWLQHDA